MDTYYIYHIPGVKIGCTKRIERRMQVQKFTQWEILEEHTDIETAGIRERELQLQYGYRVDNIQYHKSNYIGIGKLNTIPIIATHIESGIQKEYNSLTECAKEIGIGIGRITHILSPKYKRKSSYGYTFTYK